MQNLPHPLIDVLSEDSYSEEHLPGAVNFCVYETAFIDKVRAAHPDTTALLTVYGLGDSTHEARIAVERLEAAGYKNVVALPGGLEGWKSQGGAIEPGSKTHPAASGRYEIDAAASFIRWTGRNLFNFHTGDLRLSDGFIVVKEGRLNAGEFTVDMTSLHCSDITDSAMNKMLIGHLRSDDFFSVEAHPQAKFVLSSAEFLAEAAASEPNYRIEGDFTLRGVTRPITLTALVAEKSEGGFVAQGLLDLDRTFWGSIYGSGKYFARLGQHVVNDIIHLQLKIVTKAS